MGHVPPRIIPPPSDGDDPFALDERLMGDPVAAPWEDFRLALGTFLLNLGRSLAHFFHSHAPDSTRAYRYISHSFAEEIKGLRSNVLSLPPQSVLSSIPYGYAPGDLGSGIPGLSTAEVQAFIARHPEYVYVPSTDTLSAQHTPPPTDTPMLLTDEGYEPDE